MLPLRLWIDWSHNREFVVGLLLVMVEGVEAVTRTLSNREKSAIVVAIVLKQAPKDYEHCMWCLRGTDKV